MWKVLESFLRQAQVGQSRSSVINPLQWTLVIVTAALLALTAIPHAPTGLIIGVACADGLVLLLIVAAYVFFMLKNPDALRSETYSLAKTAIDRKLLGDSLTGLREVITAFEGGDVPRFGDGKDQALGPQK